MEGSVTAAYKQALAEERDEACAARPALDAGFSQFDREARPDADVAGVGRGDYLAWQWHRVRLGEGFGGVKAWGQRVVG